MDYKICKMHRAVNSMNSDCKAYAQKITIA